MQRVTELNPAWAERRSASLCQGRADRITVDGKMMCIRSKHNVDWHRLIARAKVVWRQHTYSWLPKSFLHIGFSSSSRGRSRLHSSSPASFARSTANNCPLNAAAYIASGRRNPLPEHASYISGDAFHGSHLPSVFFISRRCLSSRRWTALPLVGYVASACRGNVI